MKLKESRQGHFHVFHLDEEIDLHLAPVLRNPLDAKASLGTGDAADPFA